MKGYGREIVLIFFVTIVLFLLLSNGAQTNTLISTIGGQISNTALVLQGRNKDGTLAGGGARAFNAPTNI